MKEYNISVNDKSFMSINGIEINDKIYQEELCEYYPIDREDQIEHLFDWVFECGKDRQNDKELMISDIKYLFSLDDELIFSSFGTNSYIAKSDNIEEFNEICEEILKINEELK